MNDVWREFFGVRQIERVLTQVAVQLLIVGFGLGFMFVLLVWRLY